MKFLVLVLEQLGVIGLPAPLRNDGSASIAASQLHFMRGALLLLALLVPMMAMSATTGTEFKGVYDFVYGAATGYLGRAIAIVGGLVCLGIAAGGGKVVIAAVGMVLAIFGALGPTIINAIFQSAVIY